MRTSPAAISANLALASLLAIALSMPAGAQAPYCDSLVPRSSPATIHTYRERGDRCEGSHPTQVAGSALRLVSLTSTPRVFSSDTQRSVLLRWAPQAAAVRVRATSLRATLGYRMDTRLPPRAESFRWQLQVARAYHLTDAHLGLVAFARMSVPAGPRDVYLPLRIGNAVPGRYRMTVIPLRTLQDVTLTIWRAGAGGTPDVRVVSSQPITVPFLENSPAVVLLPALESPGLHHVILNGRTQAGLPATLDFWMMHGTH